MQCDEQISLITEDKTLNGKVWAYGWQYYAIDLGPHKGGSFELNVKRIGVQGDPDLYVMSGTSTLPSLQNFAWDCECERDNSRACDCRELSCDSCDDTGRNSLHRLASSPVKTQLSGIYIIGVAGFCCLPARYELKITLSKMGCDGVQGSGKELDVCGQCGGSGSCAGCDGKANSGVEFDVCGVCGGDGTSCLGCDNVANSGKVVDAC